MSTGRRLAAFGVALAVSFGAAAAVGSAVGPIDVGGTPPHVTPTAGGAHDHPQEKGR